MTVTVRVWRCAACGAAVSDADAVWVPADPLAAESLATLPVHPDSCAVEWMARA